MAQAMKPDGRGHWASLNEFGFTAGMRLLFWIFRIGGRWPFRLILYPVLAWFVCTKPVARRASHAYLARVGARSDLLGVLRHFASFAENILDRMILWGGLFKGEVSFFGIEAMLGMIERGTGALLLSSHLGNAELCRVLSRQRSGLKLTVLVHTRHAPAFNAMMGRIDPRSQLNLLQVTEMTPAMAILLAERIAQGEFVVIAGDRVPVAKQPRVAYASFLGQKAAFPVGPYIMASVLQCPVYLIFALRRGKQYEIQFELLRESVSLPRKDRAPMLEQLAGDYAARLEYHCRRAPLEWFNFFDFWHDPELDNTDASR
jgi:predicted LPLAT superfamily acyltransferase